METILIQGAAVPIAPALDADGQPVDLIGDVIPEHCDHKGACWSDCLALRCPRCGAPLFLPPRFLALRSAEQLEAMHQAWVRAGWPSMAGGAWCIRSDMWTVIDLAEFAHVGGLAVRNDRLADFMEWVWPVAARADRPQLGERPA